MHLACTRKEMNSTHSLNNTGQINLLAQNAEKFVEVFVGAFVPLMKSREATAIGRLGPEPRRQNQSKHSNF
jgi:hypothetical protein